MTNSRSRLRLLSTRLSDRVRSASGGGRLPPQEEEDSGRAGVAAGGVAVAMLAAERSERSRLRLRPHRPEVGSDSRTLLRGVSWGEAGGREGGVTIC